MACTRMRLVTKSWRLLPKRRSRKFWRGEEESHDSLEFFRRASLRAGSRSVAEMAGEKSREVEGHLAGLRQKDRPRGSTEVRRRCRGGALLWMDRQHAASSRP